MVTWWRAYFLQRYSMIRSYVNPCTNYSDQPIRFFAPKFNAWHILGILCCLVRQKGYRSHCWRGWPHVGSNRSDNPTNNLTHQNKRHYSNTLGSNRPLSKHITLGIYSVCNDFLCSLRINLWAYLEIEALPRWPLFHSSATLPTSVDHRSHYGMLATPKSSCLASANQTTS